MELENPSNDEGQAELENGGNGEAPDPPADDIDSTCSTPYVSAPSSPGRSPGGYFFSAPASPMHYVLSSAPYSAGGGAASAAMDASVCGSFEFEFSARGSMISADELFHNGQIRPMKLSSHLQRPQLLAPLMDVDDEEEEEGKEKGVGPEMAARGRDMTIRSRSVHRRARSMSPLRNSRFQWQDEEEEEVPKDADRDRDLDQDPDLKQIEAATPSDSASSSRSSSSGRNSKRWIFLKDLLYRSKSEGRERGSGKEKFWHSISFSPSKEKSKPAPTPPSSSSTTTPNSEPQKKPKNGATSSSSSKKAGSSSSTPKPTNGVGKRRVPPSAHERHYTANRAQAEEMRRKTFLPYRQGLLGCLGFSSRSYGAMNGFAKTLNPVPSR